MEELDDENKNVRCIIAGGRTYQFTKHDIEKLDNLPVTIKEVVSGGAKGADKCGEEWAESRNIPVKLFPANWEKFGRKAGPIRNQEMAKYADAVVLFDGGTGTANMKKEAEKEGLVIFDLTSNFEFDINKS